MGGLIHSQGQSIDASGVPCAMVAGVGLNEGPSKEVARATASTQGSPTTNAKLRGGRAHPHVLFQWATCAAPRGAEHSCKLQSTRGNHAYRESPTHGRPGRAGRAC